ncbi:hypothetical protein KAT51_00055 [bacterium]|nr:hypothetical protein [bacterium]
MPNTPVSTWRDGVSFTLGEITSKLENMHEDIKETNGKVIDHEERIVTIETIESNRKAVKAYLAGVWALVGGAVVYALQKLAPLAWSVFK